ncbi:hypothetical protein FW774_20155 [Pedobacter sp. BS3]|nr:hypothetical protein FW774_20155 [Pedobacter sp. BS3]
MLDCRAVHYEPYRHCPLSIIYCSLSTVNCQLSTVNCQLSTVNCPLSIVHCPLSTLHCPLKLFTIIHFFSCFVNCRGKGRLVAAVLMTGI